MKVTYRSQRMDITGEGIKNPSGIPELKANWPLLFSVKGFLHLHELARIDIPASFSEGESSISDACGFFKHSKTRYRGLAANEEACSLDDLNLPRTSGLLVFLLEHFQEDSSALLMHTEVRNFTDLCVAIFL